MPAMISRVKTCRALVNALPNLLEVSIGHAITADALVMGISEAVLQFRRACGQ